MYEPQRFYLLVYMALAAIPVSSGFNIDTANATVHSGDPKDFFGYKVLQYVSPRNKGIIVTAPLRLNGSGGIFKHDLDETEKWFSPNGIHSSETYPHLPRHLGLSIAADSTRTRFIACSPSLAHPCDENVYLNSLCYNVTNEFQQLSSFTPLFQKCTKKAVDLVFLFDGSESMTGAEFNENKIFIKNVMKSLKNTTFKCAAVQFSTDCRKVFDFNDYVAGTAIKKLDEEQHMKNLTNTHKALMFTLSEILENQAAGASKDATKAVVIITDGDPSDLDTRLKSVKTYESKKIIRIVIGVRYCCVDSFVSDTLILGSVGSNSWRGALNEPQKRDKKILDPNIQEDSYMGYSLSVGERNGKPLYFTGAPRFNHMGQVIVFQPDDDDWKPVQRITEDQVGSYFGAELCSVDIDSDGNTDFLLVGAPQFYLAEEKKEGMIYVYSLSDEMKLQKVFQVRAPSMGRFGTTISSLSDLNGDGLRDVAVGAPLEEDNTGAVYIYLGHGGVGIRNISSQRIRGADFHPRLRFFGQAINGDIDLGDDQLPDIVVGSKGSAVVLRSKSVLNVKTSLSFYPNVISIQEINCLEENEILLMVTVRACFEMAEATNSTAEKRINISVMLNADSTRSMYRGFFIKNKEKSRNTTHTYELTGRETCFNYSIYMNKCVKDTLSPVEINLNFSQPDAENAGAILNVDSYTRAVVKVPFERHCAKKEICIADLKVDFNFMKGEVLVTENTVFSVLITLDNIGDDSYNTSLTMHYPPGLSFSIMELTGKLTYICTGLEDVPDKTVCGISLPVYRSKSSATFNATFRVARDFEWNETLSMSVSAQRNDKTVTHMNFTPETHEPKTMAIIYNINNTGFKDFPINVSLFFPSKLEHNFEVKNYKVIVEQNKTQCSVIPILKPEDCPLKENCIAMKCDTFTLKNYSGVQFTLEGLVHFQNLKNHNTPFLKQYTGDGGEVSFKSFIKVHYDGAKYIVTSHKNEVCMGWTKASVLVEFIVPPNKLLIILTGVILGMMLLILLIFILCKRGFFKRKTIQDYEEQEAELSAQNGCLSESSHGVEQAGEENELLNEAAKKPEQAEEEKEPLTEDEKKDSPLTISE
uniref:Integrin alpha-L n=1 Tax=Fundulus heteroclitus TaxID=8078 RepID=A0A3Q2Q3N0_FUNHE